MAYNQHVPIPACKRCFNPWCNNRCDSCLDCNNNNCVGCCENGITSATQLHGLRVELCQHGVKPHTIRNISTLHGLYSLLVRLSEAGLLIPASVVKLWRCHLLATTGLYTRQDILDIVVPVTLHWFAAMALTAEEFHHCMHAIITTQPGPLKKIAEMVRRDPTMVKRWWE